MSLKHQGQGPIHTGQDQRAAVAAARAVLAAPAAAQVIHTFQNYPPLRQQQHSCSPNL